MADPIPVQSNDNYAAFLGDKLWSRIPAIYRTLDTDAYNTNGPLREMVNRIGASAAVLRRSIDRLWEDQSIETCDDWVIAYLGDLLATNLVNSLDARGQRLDVANTVYYRQRKGTVAILEEIAADITGWDVRLVEFFRRMARTRHSFDPPIGLPVPGRTAATQSLATGDGATIAFPTLNLTKTPIYRGSLQVIVNGSAAGSDDANGHITGSTLTGTIAYGTGAISLTFTEAPVAGATITVLYDYPGFDTSLQVAEGIAGQLTGSAIGGWANLRSVYGAAKAQTAFDEFSHTADLRLGVDQVGWQNISHLGVFLWRLTSFAAGITTPVQSTQCPGQYAFDPTGRLIPLFAAASRTASSYGDNWISPQEWQLPGPISAPLLQAALENPAATPLYATSVDTASQYSVTPNSLGVYFHPGSYYELLPLSLFLNASGKPTIYPTRGIFQIVDPPSNPPAPPFFVTYHFGFSSTIGAGPYDRRLSGVAADPTPAPLTTIAQTPHAPAPAIPDPSPTGAIIIQDSLTYTTISDFAHIENVIVQAAPQTRPVLRWPAPAASGPNQWILNGADQNSTLLLDGLLLSGTDIVLTGSFNSVTLRCCTLDPGNAAGPQNTPPPGDLYAQSIDQRDLAPTRLWIEANIATLTLDRCITGPIRTRMGGEVGTLAANDSILQAIPTSSLTSLLQPSDLLDPRDFIQALLDSSPLSTFLQGKLTPTVLTDLKAWNGKTPLAPNLLNDLLADLNAILPTHIYNEGLFAGIPLDPSIKFAGLSAPPAAQIQFNRQLLEAAFPLALGQAALALANGEAALGRTTVLGRVFVHRIEASESLLDDFTVVEDTQHGCLRFTAWPAGSLVPRQYECVQIAVQSPLFTSREFGQPGYAQLLASADLAILSTGPGTILQGAQNGSEMGAFAREKNPIKESSILIKYQEYMPLGLSPVLIRVT
jgi:hypothetical protein